MGLLKSKAWGFAIAGSTALLILVVGDVAAEQPPPPDTPPSAPPLVRRMAGTWKVKQRMWPSADAAAIDLPDAVARRRVVRGGFLEEVMEAVRRGVPEAFTRVACFNYNAVTRRYEYVSLDSRAPQMMTEKSEAQDLASKAPAEVEISLAGDVFLAPRWGTSTNVTFRYRLVVGGVVKDRQVVRLFLTPQSKDGGKEFLAFEYLYVRTRF